MVLIVTCCSPRQGHPQHIPWEQHPRHRDPPSCSPAGVRDTNLCRLEDSCLLFCFVLRCPCNCLLNPDCMVLIAELLCCSSDHCGWEAAAGPLLPARGTTARCAGTGRTRGSMCPALPLAAGGVNAELLCWRKGAPLIIQREKELAPASALQMGSAWERSIVLCSEGRVVFRLQYPQPHHSCSSYMVCCSSSPFSVLWIQPFFCFLGFLFHQSHLQFPLLVVLQKGTCLSPLGWGLSWVLPPCLGVQRAQSIIHSPLHQPVSLPDAGARMWGRSGFTPQLVQVQL